MTPQERSRQIFEWATAHRGMVIFDDLTDEYDKYMFVVTKTYTYYRKVYSIIPALERSYKNADSHKENGYITWQGTKLKIKE